MIKIKKHLYYIGNLFEMLWAKVRITFGKKYDSSIIPDGPYCYKPDTERNEQRCDQWHYYIIQCPYYKTLGNNWNGCKFLGVITRDFVFDDQCKICNENCDYRDEKYED